MAPWLGGRGLGAEPGCTRYAFLKVVLLEIVAVGPLESLEGNSCAALYSVPKQRQTLTALQGWHCRYPPSEGFCFLFYVLLLPFFPPHNGRRRPDAGSALEPID